MSCSPIASYSAAVLDPLPRITKRDILSIVVIFLALRRKCPRIARRETRRNREIAVNPYGRARAPLSRACAFATRPSLPTIIGGEAPQDFRSSARQEHHTHERLGRESGGSGRIGTNSCSTASPLVYVPHTLSRYVDVFSLELLDSIDLSEI